MPLPAVAARADPRPSRAGDRAHRAQPLGALPARHPLGEPGDVRPQRRGHRRVGRRRRVDHVAGAGRCRAPRRRRPRRSPRRRRRDAAVASSLGLDADVPVIGTVGNLTAKKDHESLLRAVALVRASGSRRSGSCWSDRVPCDAELRRLVADARARRPSCVLTGSRDDVPDLLPAFDVFALSSRFEGLPDRPAGGDGHGPGVRGHDGRRHPRGGHRRPRRCARRQPGDPATLARGARGAARRSDRAGTSWARNAMATGRRVRAHGARSVASKRVYDEALRRC